MAIIKWKRKDQIQEGEGPNPRGRGTKSKRERDQDSEKLFIRTSVLYFLSLLFFPTEHLFDIDGKKLKRQKTLGMCCLYFQKFSEIS